MHSKIKIVGIIIALLIVGVRSEFSSGVRHVEAQGTWTATYWVHVEGGESYLERVDADNSIAVLPLPSTVMQSDILTNEKFAASSDNQYIAYQVHTPDLASADSYLYFGARTDETCCTEIRSLDSSFNRLILAGFEPNGSRFAFAYTRSNEPNRGMMVVDAATGNILQDVPIATIQAGVGRPVWGVMGKWTTTGIQFADECVDNCDRFRISTWSLWNPDTHTFTPRTNVRYSEVGSNLEVTNEFLAVGINREFYYIPSGLITVPNVVNYYQVEDSEEDRKPIFVDSDRLLHGSVYWVGDGQAMLVQSGAEQWEVQYRTRQSGTLENVIMRDIVGTPQGWLAIVDSVDGTGTSALYHYDINTLNASFVTRFPSNATRIVPIRTPALGTNIPSTNFRPIAPDPNLRQTIWCPNFSPSRLIVGEQGRVTQGTPNRIRQSPSLEGEVIEHIPGGEAFLITAEPHCDEEGGIAWWRIEYSGISGWTAEGQGGTYWTEPVE